MYFLVKFICHVAVVFSSILNCTRIVTLHTHKYFAISCLCSSMQNITLHFKGFSILVLAVNCYNIDVKYRLQSLHVNKEKSSIHINLIKYIAFSTKILPV